MYSEIREVLTSFQQLLLTIRVHLHPLKLNILFTLRL